MLTVYSTCPASAESVGDYRDWVRRVTSWTEGAGFRGMLVYNDNALDDPWLVAHEIIQTSTRVVPLVAVQPVYASPFATARMISTIGHLHHRQVDLNLVTGGFAPQLTSLGCELDHDSRYDRLIEYGEIMSSLLSSARPVHYDGRHYRLKAARLTPKLPEELAPRVFVSGSSPASRVAAARLGADRLAYPLQIADYPDPALLAGTGMRVGIIARETSGEAWEIARRRFPNDPAGERLHSYARRSAQSSWHRDLADLAAVATDPVDGYWLYPFRAYKTFCPYFVGDYREVSTLLASYLDHGVTTLITDVPEDHEDLLHAREAIQLAQSSLSGRS